MTTLIHTLRLSAPFVLAACLAAPSTAQLTQQAYVKASNPGTADNFGTSMAMDGDTLVVGSPFEASNATGVNGDQSNNSAFAAGAVYVYVRQGATWTQQAYLKASNALPLARFGTSVAIWEDTIVVGATGEASSATGVNGDQNNQTMSGAGAVYVFVRQGATWTQEAYLKASNTEASDAFGISVAIHTDTVVVGADEEDSNASGVNGDQTDNSAVRSGAAYVFVRNAGNWSQQAYLKSADAELDDRFGTAVTVAGDWIVVGAPLEDGGSTGIDGDVFDNSATGSGAAYAFLRIGTGWTQQAYIKASNTDPNDAFGGALHMSGGTLVVGAPLEASKATGVNGDQSQNSPGGTGAAYVYIRPGGFNWSQQAYLKPSSAPSPFVIVGYRFGSSVAFDGDAIVVGAPAESSSATGVDGNEAQDPAFSLSGAGYAFTRDTGVWSQDAYLKASNTEKSDTFGGAVAASGSTYVLGAISEDSGSPGVNGIQADESALGAGAAYVFDTPINCSVKQYGANTGANYGILFSSTIPTAGSNFLFELMNFTGSGTALLALSASAASFPGFGGTVLIDPFQSLLGPGNFLSVPVFGGVGQIALLLPAGTAGLTLYGQAAKFDITQPGWLALTNGLEVTICP